MGMLETKKKELVDELYERVERQIISKQNADLLAGLIEKANDYNEAMAIMSLGSYHKRTGLYFETRLEKDTSHMNCLVKNEKLSFVNDLNRPTHKLIIGDNYHSLLNLLISHKRKIDVIYIDPPYGCDDMGKAAKTNYENVIDRDTLLSMLYPRLSLAKDLMTDDGVMFCSIDDRNQAYLKCLMDEVFGESNFVGVFDWMKTSTPPSLSKTIRKKFEYVLCYSKTNKIPPFCGGMIAGGDMPLLNQSNKFATVTFKKESLNLKIKDGTYAKGKYDRVVLEQDFVVKGGLAQTDLIISGNWKWSQETVDNEIANGTTFWIKTDKFALRYERLGDRIKRPSNIISKEECGVLTNEEANKEVTNILSDSSLFAYPKPTSLIKYLINMVTYEKKDAVVLDFFSGSGTTGHAVMELNKEDGGNRQFILCTNNEITDINPNGIAYDVTSKRLKRIMSGQCYDGTNDFKWIQENAPYMDNLEVTEINPIESVVKIDQTSPFEKIDEMLYGLPKFESINAKAEWVCKHFKVTRSKIEGDAEYRVKWGGD